MEKKNVPKIRFPGFTEPWEQRKIGECFKERKENMPEGELISVTINEGIKKFSELGRHDNSNEDKSKYKKVCVGDIAYNSMRMWQGASGYSPYEGIVSPAYTILAPIEEVVDSKCISYLFKRQDMLRLFQVNSQGMTSDNWNLKFPILSEINIMVSSNIKEQQKITTFFSMLDNLITLHHRKLENLKKQKKGLLQKMFPEKGKKVPEIRFPEFTNDWEQRKLGELSKSFEYGLNASAKEFDGENKYIRITDIDEESHNFMTDDLTSPNINLSNAGNYKLSRGDILFARIGASVGKSYIYKESDGIVYYAGFLIRARIKEEVNPEFVFQNTLTKDYEKYISVTSQRSGQPGVNAQEYAEYKIMVPNKEEQDKISDYMRKFDNLISLHQRKLEHLQKQKKALLQQMFV